MHPVFLVTVVVAVVMVVVAVVVVVVAVAAAIYPQNALSDLYVALVRRKERAACDTLIEEVNLN